MTLPTRQGFEQLAQLLTAGIAIFALLAFLAHRRGGSWRRNAISAGILGGLAVAALVLGYTIAPNIPTPAVPLTARFAQNPVADGPEVWARGQIGRAHV